ncbi:MAG: hypothetical protein GXP21_01855 [Gammaproteobacteria bacterium]|nr:hypothetical protein [Gammaproteobacteria bacterium]
MEFVRNNIEALLRSFGLELSSDTAAINLLGKQRMLSQRMAKEAMMIANKIGLSNVINTTMQNLKRPIMHDSMATKP